MPAVGSSFSLVPAASPVPAVIEVLDEPLQRVGPAVEHQIVRQRALVGRDLGVRLHVRRIHDRHVEPRFHAVMQEDGVQHRARFRREAEAHVRHAEAREDARQLALDEANALDRLDRRVDPLRVAGRERERQVVVDEIFRLEAVLADDDVVDLLRDLELPLARLRHADRVDRQRDERRAMLLRERHDAIDALAAVLHVDGVDDRAARDRLERALDDARLGRVDHDRRLDGHREQLDDLRHLLRFVAALGDRDADVEHVRARIDLLARDVRDALVVVGEQQPLHFARALRVHALADRAAASGSGRSPSRACADDARGTSEPRVAPASRARSAGDLRRGLDAVRTRRRSRARRDDR